MTCLQAITPHAPLPFAALLVLWLVGLAQPLANAQEPSPDEGVRFSSTGVRIPGDQFLYDCGFELLDFNGDGLLDVFLPNTSMMSFAVHLNEGASGEPAFGQAVGYPVNLTETEPQTLEHSQSFAVCDLNSDGLFDLIMFDGQLRMVFNTGTPHGPNHWRLAKYPQFFPGADKMIAENARYSTGPESMFWNKGIFARQVLTMTVADWDADGLDDLLVCRFKGEAPGVQSTGSAEQWTAWGRLAVSRPSLPPPASEAPTYLGKLDAAPPRGLYFYKNVGSKQEPWFDAGQEICTADGQSIAAPNPIVADVNADGLADVISTEAPYSCNAFRVDWPTEPSVRWFHRSSAESLTIVEQAEPIKDSAGQEIAAGVQVRLADIRSAGVKDLFVMDHGHKGSIRWYRNQADHPNAPPKYEPAVTLKGQEFARFGFMFQPLVVDWFGPGSRDLILHGNTDAHCKWSLRRTALYKNVATRPGELKYEFAGYFNYQGDLAMVPPTLEERPYDVYGSAISVFPDDGSGGRQMMMSVDGKLYLFSGLATDGLTFENREPLNLPANRNRHKSWQEIPVSSTDPVRYIRISNDSNGMGNLRDSFLHIVNFEALSAGKNYATPANGVEISDQNNEPVPWYRVQRPMAMFTPGNEPNDDQPNFTSFGYYIGPATVTLKEPVTLDKIRFRLSDREQRWYDFRLPFYWQGKLLRDGTEQGEPWYQYKIEVSADKEKWTTVADTMGTEMMRNFPYMVDWNRDGAVDMVLGVLNSKGIWPATKEYRLYRNQGTNSAPRFADYEPLCDEQGEPLKPQAFWYSAYALQCGLSVEDIDGDGRLDLTIEGFNDGGLLHYRNVSSDEAPGIRFQSAGHLGTPRPIRYPASYRYFCLADADGDGVLDVLNSDGANLAFFKGHSASAPARIEDLAIREATSAGVSFSWTRPKDATHYDIRWSEKPITDLNWPLLPGIAAAYDSPDPAAGPYQAPIGADRLPEGKVIYVAVRSQNERQEASALSASIETATWPLERIVLRNGPEDSAAVPDYRGNEASYVDAHAPDRPPNLEHSVIVARAPGEQKQKVALVRFRDVPPLEGIERATIEFTTVADENQLAAMATLATSCNACRDDWDTRVTTWSALRPGSGWAENELDAGGKFISMATARRSVAERHTIAWEVTQELQAMHEAGQNTLSVMIRVDNTGKYVAGAGYQFYGSQWPDIALRPRLNIIARNASASDSTQANSK